MIVSRESKCLGYQCAHQFYCDHLNVKQPPLDYIKGIPVENWECKTQQQTFPPVPEEASWHFLQQLPTPLSGIFYFMPLGLKNDRYTAQNFERNMRQGSFISPSPSPPPPWCIPKN
jgi:hypothetical protein